MIGVAFFYLYLVWSLRLRGEMGFYDGGLRVFSENFVEDG